METTRRSELPASVRKHGEQLRVLEHAVSRSLAEANDASAGLRAVIRAVCETQNWECGRYFRVDGEAGVLRFADAWGVPDPAVERFIAESRSLVYRRGIGLSGQAWQSGQPLWSSDVTKDPRSSSGSSKAGPTRAMGMHGTFVFPVVSDGKTIGVLSFASRKSRVPDEHLLQAIHAIGSQIGQFLQRKQAEAVLHASKERFRRLTELTSDVYWEQDDQYRFTSFSGTGTERVNPASLQWIGKKRWEQNYINMAAADWAAHIAILDARMPFRDLELCRRNAAGEKIWVSISGEPVFDSAGQFTGYRGVGKDITARKREEQLRVLEHTVTRSLAEAVSGSAGLSAVLRAVCETERWECGRYFSPDKKAGVMRFGVAWGVPNESIERYISGSRDITYPPGVGLMGRVWQSGQPLWVSDLYKDARVSQPTLARESGMHGAFVFPIISEGKTIGVLAFNSREVREPEERLLQAISVIGSQIGQFLQRKQAEEVLRGSEERFRAIFEQAEVGIALRGVDPLNPRWLRVNQKLCDILGYTREELLQLSSVDITPPEDRDLAVDYNEQLLRGEITKYSREKRYVRKDGRIIWASISLSAVKGPDGRPTHIISIIQDMTDRKRAEETVSSQALQQRLLAEFGRQALATLDLVEVLQRAASLVAETLKVEYANVLQLDSSGRQLIYQAAVGWPQEWVGRRVVPAGPGTRLSHILSSRKPLVIEDYKADSEFSTSPLLQFDVASGVQVPIFGARETFGIISAHTPQSRRFSDDDISFLESVASILAIAVERKNAEDKLAHLAQFDTVTGLPNRYLFHDRMSQTLTQAQRNRWQVGVLFIDLDRFKAVNDTYGHSVGDRVLHQVAARIKECVRGGDTVGRLSGDEFAVVLTDLAKADDAGLVAQKIARALETYFELDDHQIYISASIGIALYPGDGGEPDTLLRNADTAMYRAKEQGRNGYQFYLPQMNERLMQRLQLEAHMRGALERKEFLLHYQPKVNLNTGKITGLEALLRWRRGELTVSPAEFVPVLEQTGLIVPVGEWVLKTVCEQLKRWEQEGVAVRPVAVNLSSRQFQRTNLAAMVEAILRETGVAPALLEFELTETLLMSDAEEAVETLRELKALGVRLAVDDFGTGYSSLAYLKRFPLDTLKIDRAFIRDAITNPDDATIALSMINLAHSLKLKVVAEGVETEGQLNFLRSHGCDEMQGYYFARPLPVEECTRALIEDRRLQFPQAETAPETPSALLVDDNEDDLLLLKRALAPEGFRILTANSPRDGFELLARHEVDIVISDFQMPEMTGIEFLSRVRKLYPKAARVLASSSDDAPTITSATNIAGIHKFLSKKWDADRLRAEVLEAYQQRR